MISNPSRGRGCVVRGLLVLREPCAFLLQSLVTEQQYILIQRKNLLFPAVRDEPILIPGIPAHDEDAAVRQVLELVERLCPVQENQHILRPDVQRAEIPLRSIGKKPEARRGGRKQAGLLGRSGKTHIQLRPMVQKILRESVSRFRIVAAIEPVLREYRVKEDAIRPEVAVIADAGERHVRYAKRGDCLDERNHGRPEYHKGMAPLVFGTIWDKRRVRPHALIQQAGMPPTEPAHAIGIPQTQQATVCRERMLSQQLVERFLWSRTGIGIVLVDNQVRQAVPLSLQNQPDESQGQARIGLGLLRARRLLRNDGMRHRGHGEPALAENAAHKALPPWRHGNAAGVLVEVNFHGRIRHRKER